MFFPWQGSGLIYILLVLWVYPNTALFNPPPKNIWWPPPVRRVIVICWPHSARRVETRRAEWARWRWSAQLRRSSDSVAAALRAASAPSQQHQLCRGRDAQNERDGTGLRSSVAAATPSHGRSSVAAALRAPWAVDGALGSPSKIIE